MMGRFTCGLLTAALACVALIPAWAQDLTVPEHISFQGALFEDDGVTPRTGAVDLEIRLYAAKDSATAAWGESHDDVTLQNGMFSILLGEGAAIAGGTEPHTALNSIFTQAPYWIGVTVVGEPELQERQELVSAPYAFTASTAIRAKHGVPPGTIAAWGGTAIPDGWVACDGAAYSATAEEGKYKALFDAIQHAWGGAGDDFNVPNFGGRALMGDTSSAPGQNTNTDSSSAGVTPKTLGHLLGEETHRLTEAEMAAHTHSFSDKHYTGEQSRTGGSATARDNQLNGSTKNMTNAGGIDTNNDITPDAAAPHNNMQPSTAVTFIIKY